MVWKYQPTLGNSGRDAADEDLLGAEGGGLGERRCIWDLLTAGDSELDVNLKGG